MANKSEAKKKAASGEERDLYLPRTDLGRKLWEIRKKIVASGAPLLGWEEIEAEIADRRGESS